MSHRMAGDLETLCVQVAYLISVEVAGRAEKSSGQVEGGVEAELTKHWSGGDKVGLAPIVKGDTDTRFGRIPDGFAYVQAAPARSYDPRHLAAESFDRQNVANIAGHGLAQFTARELQFVV